MERNVVSVGFYYYKLIFPLIALGMGGCFNGHRASKQQDEVSENQKIVRIDDETLRLFAVGKLVELQGIRKFIVAKVTNPEFEAASGEDFFDFYRALKADNSCWIAMDFQYEISTGSYRKYLVNIHVKSRSLGDYDGQSYAVVRTSLNWAESGEYDVQMVKRLRRKMQASMKASHRECFGQAAQEQLFPGE